MLQIQPMFAVPCAQARFPSASVINPQLRSLFLARESEGARYANADPSMKTRHALFESRFDLFSWPDEPIKALSTYCMQTLFATVGQLSGYEAATLARLRVNADAWFHITRKGGYFGLHNHAMASWSGVYCVDSGEPSQGPSSENSGVLSFAHPAAMASMFVDMSVVNVKPPFNACGVRNYRLTAGELILFPSWLMHEVLPYEGDGTRITVAFNCWFKMP